MFRLILITILLSISTFAIFAIPFAPGQDTHLQPPQVFPSEIYPKTDGTRDKALPQNYLAIMVEFQDVTFDLIPDYPDSLPHDKAYFERLFFHVFTYWNDASHGQYAMNEDNYTVWDNIFTVPQTMAYYGEDDANGQQIELICEFVLDVIALADPEIDFSQYDAIVLIHAGAGQETDVDQSDLIMTTFLSRRSLQAGIDPENDDYPGIETDDGIILKEFVIIPETENHPDSEVIYGLQGVLAHNIGHQLGLPTLFDNNSENGRSYGIGGFGIMGTGVWIGNSIVPPLPCAWSRYYLGWEDDNLIELDNTASDLEITYPTADDNITPKLYKINITEDEYFLLENRQQNPDGSTQVWYELDNQGNIIALDPAASFTFPLVANQKYYAYPNEDKPKFDYMVNSFEGCEWDFYLPGLGGYDGNVFDGSGLLIWHIDENVINANFDPDFEMNTVNDDASHKGVDLEEANGIQNLDSNFYGFDSYFGSGYDSYRAENNNYFGKSVYQGLFSIPTAESYYGGIPLEIMNISEAGLTMSFDVEFEWSLNADYIGENPISVMVIDFDDDGENEILQVLPNGEIYLWKNDVQYPGFPIDTNSSVNVPCLPSYDENANSVLMPANIDLTNSVALYNINLAIPDSIELVYFVTNREWAAPVVVNPDETCDYRYILPLNDQTSSQVFILDSEFQEVISFAYTSKIESNLALDVDNNTLNFFRSELVLTSIDLTNFTQTDFDLANSMPSSSNTFARNDYPEVWSLQMADINANGSKDYVFTTSDSTLHVHDPLGDFPTNYETASMPLDAFSIPSFADIDGNGYPEILIGGENSFAVFDKNGKSYTPSIQLSNPDSTFKAAGIIAVDIDGDGQKEIMGNMSRNRLCVWRNKNNNDWIMDRNYPISLGERSWNYPVIGDYNQKGINSYIAANNGAVFRNLLDLDASSNFGWIEEYGNLQRTASWLFSEPPGPATSNDIFDKNETYFYPNPLSTTFRKAIDHGNEIADQTIILRIMTRQNADVQIKIFDIAANKIYQNTVFCENGFASKVQIDASKLASGVYFAVLKAKGKVYKLKFAIEK